MSENLEPYFRYVEHYDLSQAQKAEILTALYHVMKGFVDRAFRRDPTQLALGYSPYLPSDCPDSELESIDKTLSEKGATHEE